MGGAVDKGPDGGAVEAGTSCGGAVEVETGGGDAVEPGTGGGGGAVEPGTGGDNLACRRDRAIGEMRSGGGFSFLSFHFFAVSGTKRRRQSKARCQVFFSISSPSVGQQADGKATNFAVSG